MMRASVIRSGRRWRNLGMIGVPVLAIGVAAFATRAEQAPPPQAGHHHGPAAGADALRAVSLSPDAAHRIGITYAVVTEEAVAREVRVAGQIAVDETRVQVITSRVDGWIELLHVAAIGERIAAGAPMLTLFSPMLTAAQDELLLAKRLVNDMADADSAVRAQALSMLAAARSRLAALDVSDDDITAVEQRGRAGRAVTLRSRSAGFVMEKNVAQGERIMVGDVLYRVADLTRVWLEGDVYEQDLAAVHVGQRVSANVQAIPGTSFAGRVAYVSPALAPETRTARLRVELPNPGYRLKPGMVATLRLAGTPRIRMLTVPRSAVLSTGERHIVFVKRSDGMLEPRAVAIGAVTDERIAILNGIARGDSVVASATFLVDAESNLGTAMGGMGNMPGMDIVAPGTRD